MPNKDRNIPKRRFKEFENEDAWELRKLGECSSLITKGTTPRDKSGVGDVNFVKVENLVNGEILPLQKIQIEEHEGYLKRSQLVENDILFSIAGTLGRTAVVKKSILPANTNQALSIIRGYEFNKNFLVTILRGNVIKEFIKKNPTIGAQPNLSLEQVSNLCFSAPCTEEQSAIGTFFSALDQQITLHQRKLDKLKHVKQAYLSEMFPAEGERVPKRRFPGFTDDWELRKLGELIDNLKGGVSITPNDYIENGYRTIPKGAVNDTGIADLSSCKNVSVDFFEKNYFSKTITGELITSLRDLVPSAPNLGRIVRIVGQFEEFIMPQGVYSLKTGENLLEDFLIAYSNCYIYRNVIQSEKNGSTQVHIRNGEFLNIKIQLPTLPEQKAIGTFFSTLDQQITLHQRKLEKLKNLKKALLNELFV
ncbi:TPA: restriction endonuclease subunit S [Streptococcus suis]